MNDFGIIKISKKLHISVFCFFALLFFFTGQGFVYSLLFLASAALHETAHLFFLYRYGAIINRIAVFPFGIDINADTSRLSYKKELICTVAGCLANLFFAAAAGSFMLFYPSPHLLFFIMCNTFLGTLNLIPLSFFDGGKALRLIIYDSLDIDRAFYVQKVLDIVSACIFLCFSLLVLAGSHFNFSVYAVIIYAAISTLAFPGKKPV